MGLSFSGLGSGLPIDDWIKALVKIKQDKIDILSTKQKDLETKKTNLNSLGGLYTAMQSSATKWMDTLLGPSSDFFNSVSVSSSEDGKENKSIIANVTNLSTPSEFEIEVKSLATQTKVSTDNNDAWKKSTSKMSDLGITNETTLNINGKEIAVKPDMTVDELVYKIGNSGAGVDAYLKGGSLVIENKETGQKDVDISGDFADKVGLSDAANQKMGSNAVYVINGEEKESSSNKLTSADTGVVGLSLDLKSTTTSPVTIKIARTSDEAAVEKAMNEFITAFNDVISQTDKQTKIGGTLNGENQLVSIRNSLRTMVTEPTSSGKYKSLADIGITTGAPGMGVEADTSQLVMDKEKFKAAFEADPDAVKALLVGDTQNGTKGLMQNIQAGLEPALNVTNGYFKARGDSLNSELSNMGDTINKKNSELEVYQANLQKKYTAMDLQIAKLNQQFEQMKQQMATLFPD